MSACSRRLLLTCFALLLPALVPSALPAGVLDPALEEHLLSTPPMELVRVLLVLDDQLDLAATEDALLLRAAPGGRVPVEVRYRTVLDGLQRIAALSQPDVLAALEALPAREEIILHDRFWIRNIIVLSAPAAAVPSLAGLRGVSRVFLDGFLEHERPVAARDAVSEPEAAEQGLRAINAHRLWERGFDGTGRIVMNIDTGVEGNNQSFNSRWRGALPGVPASAAWFDPETNTTFPTDGDASTQHGTHTMGTMCGLYAATGDTLGVAPGANWIAAKTLNSSPHTSRSIAAFQWAANPDGDPGTLSDVPDAISCSWRDPNVASTECSGAGGYWDAIDAIEALGTAVVFSAGNSGPAASSLTPPKNRVTNAVNIFSVGAVNANTAGYPIASFSSRGPATCPGPDSLIIKPEVSAPGVDVRSASGTNGFRTLDGTSMASPHVAGSIALLRQAAPYLTGTEIKRILLTTAADLGAPGDDNDYGRGMIDLWAAYQALADTNDPNPPEDLTAYSDYATPASMLLQWTNPATLVGGSPIGPFVMRILRDSVLVADVADSLSSYVDTGLVDGAMYEYTVRTRLLANDSLSPVAQASWTAGGARTPAAPGGLTVSGTTATGYTIRWMNPSRQTDGTPFDDFAGVRLYRDDVPLPLLVRTAADTARMDSTTDTPPAGLHAYRVTVVDNELPENESAPSNTGFTPLELPFFDDFPLAGPPNSAIWRSLNVEVNGTAVSPPSPPNAANFDGTPAANGDTLTSLDLDLSALQGAGVALSFMRQPRGTGDNPELTDTLIVEFLNNLGAWIAVRRYPGLNSTDPVPPFAFDAVGVDGVDPAGGTFFHNGFRLRFRSKATSGNFDDWFVDDVYLGVPSGTANIAPSAVVAPRGQVSNAAPVTPVVRTLNVSAVTAGLYTLALEITGPGTPFTAQMTDSGLAAGETRTLTFPSAFTPDAVGAWQVRVITTLAGDPVPGNDTLNSQFFVVESLTLPVIDSFPDSGAPNPLIWTSVNTVVTMDGDTEPSPPYALNFAGNPTGTGLDTVTTLTIDLTGLEGMGVSLAFFQQPQGLGDAPEAADSLVAEAFTSTGVWVPLMKLPGAANRPFTLEKLNLDSMSAGGGSFFHSGFRFRLRSRAQTGTTTPDDWFVDDVFFGVPGGNPVMSLSTLRVADSVLVGTVDSTTYALVMTNDNPFGRSLDFTVEEAPDAPWLTLSPLAGSIPGNGSGIVRLRVDFSAAVIDSYRTTLIVSGNDSTNAADTVEVWFMVSAAPAMAVRPDSLFYSLPVPGAVTDSFVVANAGAGPLEYAVTLEPDLAGAARAEMTSAGGSSFTGSPRVRGNGFQVVQDATLTKVEFGLTVPQNGTGVEFFVYEATAAAGTYTKVQSQVKTVDATSGFQLVSSDPVRWPLTAGRWYYIGAAWQGATGTEYRYSTVTLPPTWGTVLGRYIGPNTAFPGPATLSISSFTTGPYFSALETGTPFGMTLVSSPSGVVAPGDSARVVFSFSTAGLPAMTYHNAVRVSGNDPLLPSVRVAVDVDNVTAAEGEETGLPEAYALDQNYPNPFNPSTTIRYALPAASTVSLTVYSILGQEVASLVRDVQPAGVYTVDWNAVNGRGLPLGSGVYFYRLEARAADGSRAFTEVRKLLLIR